jgi:phage terminase large subunit-like protein
MATLSRGERVIAFIERFCLVPSGDLVGKPMRLEPFQKRFIVEIYDNPFGTRRAYLSIARKNGKTGLIAAILLAHIAGPEARRNAQIVSGAMSREQAGIVFDLAAKMVRLSPELSKVIRIVPSTKHLIGLRRDVEYRALSAEGKTAHGLSPVLAILDEVGQVKGPRDDFVSAITTSQGAYRDALLIAISTQAPTDADMFSLWLDGQANAPDPRVVAHVYSAPEECQLGDRAAWAAANPALGKFKAISDMEYESKLATDMPTNEPEFRNFSLNQRVEAASPFVTKSVWEANGAAPTPIDGRSVYLGLDLAEVQDLCALTAVDAEDYSVNSTFWLPAEGLLEKSRHDHVPYDIWEKQGHLLTTPGRAVEYEYIAEHLRGVFDRADVVAVGFDRHLFKHLKPWLVKAQFSEDELAKFVEFGQGTASMTPALRDLEVLLLNAKLRHGCHPILDMCARNVRVVGESGSRKFDKKKSRGRIDGMSALADAVGVMPSQATEDAEFQIAFL